MNDTHQDAANRDPERWTRLGKRLAIGAAGLLALFLVYVAVMVGQAPSVKALRQSQSPQATVLMSDDGKPLSRFERQQREPVPLKSISPYVTQALIATEDHRFLEHKGLDWKRLLKAVFRTATGRVEGGSTLTQQLARNLFPEEIGRARTLNRKIKEMATAWRIERVYTKDQILESYLNTAPFLYNVAGIELAARTYFDKSAADLDVLESATLIGMLKGTHYYNPVINPERALKRRDLVLSQMVRRGVLADASFQQLKGKPLKLDFSRQTEEAGGAPHFSAHVRKWLIDWADRNDYDLYRDGLVVETTLDTRLQEAATRAVERQAGALQDIANVEWSQATLSGSSRSPEAYAKARGRAPAFDYFWRRNPALLTAAVRDSPEFKKAVAAGATPDEALATVLSDSAVMSRLRETKTRLEAGLVAVDPRTGAVKAWVGSRDYSTEQFDHVSQAARQPGSTFKPIVYAAALEMGMTPDRVYQDEPVEIRLGDGKVWRPTDMHGSSGRSMTLWEGLVYSKNTITTRVMQDVGLPGITNLAQSMGITHSKLDSVPSMALGTSPVTLLEMASVYATIANAGEYREPMFVRRIKDRHGQVVAEFPANGHRALSFGTAMNMIDMMRGVVSYGTGGLIRTRFDIKGDVGGKTGTTQNNTDGWFISINPELVTGSWVGFNDQHVTMRSSYWGQGGHNALLLVGDFLQSAFKGKLISNASVFPTPVKPPTTVVTYANAPYPLDLNEGAYSGDIPTNVGVIEVSGQSPVFTDIQRVDATGIESAEPPRSAEELGRILGGMGRDPGTGSPAPSEILNGAGSGGGDSGEGSPAPVPLSVPPRDDRPAANEQLGDVLGPRGR